MSDTELLRVSALRRRFGEREAVRDVSFAVRAGQVVGLLGPNGAGKTTTLQMVAGVLAPHGGSVSIAGADMLGEPGRAKRALGYLPEQPPLYPQLTVDEYLRHAAALRGVARVRRAAAVTTALARCGLESVATRVIGNLSKGFRQRVGIAQAIVHSPSVVVLDEPTVGLDPIQIVEIRALVRELGREHAVVLSTHILPEVQAACDRVLVLAAGRIVLEADLADLDAETSLLVGLVAPPPLEALREACPGATVEVIAKGRFRVSPGGRDLARGLARQAAAGGWDLYELTPCARSLESRFVELTSADVDHAAPGGEARLGEIATAPAAGEPGTAS
ncbi:MAG: ABC transporter ATP-binding protein [Ectothiorhodospiraceae bacterium]|nr:ABC transporter ATP-binding protein [Chromatiales bacterium]MCP5157338.1 ABC transporter ATP-binding protein [Ectothiorhodospiraceae bacterium]